MACVYLTWISLTKASRLILPAPPISAASASRRKWRVVSTSSSTSLHLWYKSIFCCLLYTYSVIKKNVQKKFFLWSLKHVFESKHSTRISGLWLLNFKILWDQLIVWWFLYTCTYSVIQNVSRKFSSYGACSTTQAFLYFDYLKCINYLSMKLFNRSKQGAFLGGQGLSVHSSSSVRESLLECPSPCLRPYLGV